MHEKKIFLIDSHCHLNLISCLKKKNNIKYILEKSFRSHVYLLLTVSVSLQDFKNSVKLFNKYKNILYSCGIHPLNHDIQKAEQFTKLKNLILNNKNIIALGETGLDFYKYNTTKKEQCFAFENHIELSIKYNKPLIIHTRNAKKKTLDILSQKEYQSCYGVIHSFTGDIDMARRLLDLGFYISFSGIITFKNAKDIKEIVKFIPINKILIETDSPYLTPEPVRGTINMPSYLLYVAKYISKLKKINIYDMAKIIKKNFFSLFNLPKIKLNKIIYRK
ncbi:TatD family hydrolase [Buchnera aphidicola]|uniref:TatD family hydrolase n=1 Tax=Buchnera aphidicola TaxID=9 RepID=UPI0031B85746